MAGAFTWEHLVKGPDEFRVKITKLKSMARCVRLGAELLRRALSGIGKREDRDSQSLRETVRN